jgi:hypothetical protein
MYSSLNVNLWKRVRQERKLRSKRIAQSLDTDIKN